MRFEEENDLNSFEFTTFAQRLSNFANAIISGGISTIIIPSPPEPGLLQDSGYYKTDYFRI